MGLSDALSYSWRLWLGGLPGGLDGLGDVGPVVNVSRDAHRGPNTLFEVLPPHRKGP